MWIALWLVISCVILGIAGWSYAILQQQKKAWKTFAARHELEYTAGKTMDAPQMRGRLGNQFVSFFTAQEQTKDVRGQRFVTVIEIDLRAGMPTGAAMGTPSIKTFVNALRFDYDYTPESAEGIWSADYPIRTRDAERLAAYLTPERMAVLHKLFQMKNANVLYFFDQQDALIRIETNDPLRDVEKIEKIIKRVLTGLDVLMPNEEERKLAEEERRARTADAAAELAAQRAAERALAAAAANVENTRAEQQAAKGKSGPYLDDGSDA